MFKRLKLTPVNLAMFEGGAAGAAAAAPGTAQAGEGSTGVGDTQAGRVNTQRGKKGAYDNVVFGKQADNTVPVAEEHIKEAVQTKSLEERRKAFNDLVNGEYKDLYTEATQSIINRRFKETKDLEAQVRNAAPILETLMQHYNIADGDMTKLLNAVESDDTYWRDAAYDAGMDVEQYKRFQKLERENKAFAEAERQRKGQQQADAQIQKWYSEAEALSQQYPDFDLNSEVKNPQFISLLRAGLPVEHAYKVIHLDEIMQNTASQAAASAEKKVVDNIRAKGKRPAENGTANQSAFTVKDDVSKLTKGEREEIAKRVARGEKISF